MEGAGSEDTITTEGTGVPRTRGQGRGDSQDQGGGQYNQHIQKKKQTSRARIKQISQYTEDNGSKLLTVRRGNYKGGGG